MAFVGTVNQAAATTLGVHLYRLVVELLASGQWTVRGSSDGSTFQNTGQTAGPYNVLTGGGTGAGGLGNNGAWVRLRDTGGREILFQVGPGGVQLVSFWYSRAAQFSTGGAATTAPTATDSLHLVNVTTTPTTSIRTHVVVSNTAINGIYPWYLMGTVSGTGARSFFVAMEPLHPGADFSRASLGDDPVVFFTHVATAPTESSVADTSTGVAPQTGGGPLCWHREGEGDELGVQVAGFVEMNDNGTQLFPNGSVANPYSGGDDRCRILFGRSALSPPAFVKGVSAVLCWKGISGRQYPDTISLASNSRVYFEDLVVPWVDTVAPVV